MFRIIVCLLTYLLSFGLLAETRPTLKADYNIDHYEISSDPNGQTFSYKTLDNQWRDETVEINPKTGALVISGWYRYTGPDGIIYQVKYVADENGFRPLGTHLPGADLSDPNAFNVLTPLVDSGISRTVLLSLVG
ncbi:larval cuticle protein 65Ag1-like [Anopheles funestus]|uniref:larval cuticle protein 65Ag1-like n=1 Tax=Anopheles funestus TaxID=62324 RepID=UPI0020C6C254|nr:larval cuticle protein 65Ag1-like [Anopheles funestus]